GKTPVEALLEVAEAEVAAMETRIAAELNQHDEAARARAELGMGTPTHEMRLVQRYLTAATNRCEKAKRLINKHGANNRPAIHPDERPQPRWKPYVVRAEGAGDYRGVPPEHITANGPVGPPCEIPEAAAAPSEPEPERPVAPA